MNIHVSSCSLGKINSCSTSLPSSRCLGNPESSSSNPGLCFHPLGARSSHTFCTCPACKQLPCWTDARSFGRVVPTLMCQRWMQPTIVQRLCKDPSKLKAQSPWFNLVISRSGSSWFVSVRIEFELYFRELRQPLEPLLSWPAFGAYPCRGTPPCTITSRHLCGSMMPGHVQRFQWSTPRQSGLR